MMSKPWPHLMQSESVTQVSYSHGMWSSQAADCVREFTFALQKLCASHSCALSISIQQKPDGVVELIAHTLLLRDVVSAFAAKHLARNSGCIVTVEIVPAQALTNINAVMQQVLNLRVNHGH